MTATPKSLSRALLTNSSATLYTVPSSTTTIITNIVLANTSAVAVPVTVALDGVVLVPAMSLAANQILALDVRQPLATTKLITGFAGTTSVVTCHIGGLEIT